MRLSPSGPLFAACIALAVSCGDPGTGGGGGGGGGGGDGSSGGGSAAGGGAGTGGSATGGGSSDGGGTSTGGGSATGGSGGGTSSGGGTGTGGSTSGGGGTGGGAAGGGNVTVIVEPSDNGAALKAAITNATTSVHMTMYLLSNNGIIDALIAQHNAGHEVEVLLNQTFTNNDGSNTSVYAQLVQAGVQVRWAPNTFTLTHEKCVIIDNSTAWIMTMNATGSAPSSNREYLAVDTQPGDVAEAEAIFEADWANTPITPSGPLTVAPTNAEARVSGLIALAHTRVDMEGEELSDTSVVNALVSAQNRGCTVHVVLSDATPTPAQTSAVATLKAAGVQLVTLHNPYIHAKTCAIDAAKAYVGSANFTASSMNHNRELGVLITDSTQVMKIITTTDADFGNGTAL